MAGLEPGWTGQGLEEPAAGNGHPAQAPGLSPAARLEGGSRDWAPESRPLREMGLQRAHQCGDSKVGLWVEAIVVKSGGTPPSVLVLLGRGVGLSGPYGIPGSNLGLFWVSLVRGKKKKKPYCWAIAPNSFASF